jgi:four helix bundle protein
MKDEKDDLRSRTKAFALRIIALYDTLSRSGAAHVLGHQALRSGTSVGANFREAHRARSNAEFISKVGGSLKELEETSYWLELLTESGAVKATKFAALLDETSQLTAILTAIVKKLRARSWNFIPHPSSLILSSHARH